MKIIALFNQKGGVAKSTTATNLAGTLAEKGFKTLLIDLDPQHNASSNLGFENTERTIYDCLKEESPIKGAIYSTQYENLDIVPASIELSGAEIELSTVVGRETLLKECVEIAHLDYEYVIIDLPPSLGLLSINGLAAATHIIVPVEPGEFALKGIEQLLTTFKIVRRKLNSNLTLLGVLLTKVNNTKVCRQTRIDLQNFFGDYLFNTEIPQNTKIPEAQIQKQLVIHYDQYSKGSLAYRKLTEEVIANG